MRKPEEIKKEIEKLNSELLESKQYYQYELLCNSEWSNEMIGFFNIGNARKILTALYEGEKLQCRHAVYGNFNVFMNPQKNRILVKNEDNTELKSIPCNKFENSSTVIVYKSPINEDTILKFIIWSSSEWYINKE